MNTACSVSPPGTGKTTYLSRQIQNAARKHGSGSVFVASFTKAAAVEVAGRNQGVRQIGTLHAHGYRAMGERYEIAENHLREWSKDEPQYRMTGDVKSDIDNVRDTTFPTTEADGLFAEMQLLRARLVPVDRWRLAVRAFATRWENWKRYNGMIDFADMIAMPLEHKIPLPSAPTVGFFDEAQDFTPMEMALVRQWGADMEYIVICGDDDQTIYEWAGASPDVMIDGECASRVVLKQSYRVPKAVHAEALKVIERVKKREEKEYLPRDADGAVVRLRGMGYTMPSAWMRHVEKDVADGRSVMILASCSYMLEPVIKELRAAGMPFHNPYREKAGAWNPLRRAGAGRVSSVDQVAAYAEQVPLTKYAEWGEPMLDIKKFLCWYDTLKVNGNIPRGAKPTVVARLSEMTAKYGETEFGGSMLRAFFAPECGVFEHLGAGVDGLQGAMGWYLDNVPAAKKRVMEYAAEVVIKRGVMAIAEKPRVVVGTIHSVKGAEADSVYIVPDLSRNAYMQMHQTRAGMDAVLRLKYVAYTRAREKLTLLDPASSYAM